MPTQDLKSRERFDDAAAFERWLEANGDAHPGIWMMIAKAGAPRPSVSYTDAVDVALCFGWVDSQKRPLDDDHYLQAFTRRRPRSPWSKRNVERATAMIEAERMRPTGQAEVDRARADGRWEAAYSGAPSAQPSAEFLAALERSPAAAEFYATLNAANRYAIYFRIHTAKREDTKARLIEKFIGMLERHETLH